MKKYNVLRFISVAICFFAICNKPAALADDQYDNRLSGGFISVFDATSKAFTHSISGPGVRDGFVHEIGDKAFEQTFVSAPLWCVGLLKKVQGTAYYLNHGRARTVEEAIVWHGGEAGKSKTTFMSLNKNNGEALLLFKQSL